MKTAAVLLVLGLIYSNLEEAKTKRHLNYLINSSAKKEFILQYDVVRIIAQFGLTRSEVIIPSSKYYIKGDSSFTKNNRGLFIRNKDTFFCMG